MGETHGRFGDRRGDHKPNARIVAQKKVAVAQASGANVTTARGKTR
jgi:hypothetical protein